MSQENFDQIKLRIEAILFSYGEWISIHEIMNILKLDSELMVKNSLEELKSRYENGFSFYIISEDGKYKMSLKQEFEKVVEDLISGVEIPQKVLKVLSVIAYEQPVSKTRLAEILGRYVKDEVDYLYKNKFVSYEKKGIGKYYKVTKKFFEYFNIDEELDFRSKANQSITNFLNEESNENKNIGSEAPEKISKENLDSKN